MTQDEEWIAALVARDQLMMLCFIGVAAFSLNWFVWPLPRAREVMTWIAIAVMITILAVRLVWRE